MALLYVNLILLTTLLKFDLQKRRRKTKKYEFFSGKSIEFRDNPGHKSWHFLQLIIFNLTCQCSTNNNII